MKRLIIIVMIILMPTICFSLENAIIEIPWGRGELSAGTDTLEENISGFSSPTSFSVYENRFYILDAPNFRILVYNEDGSKEKIIKLPQKNDENAFLYTDIIVKNKKIYVGETNTGRILQLELSKGELKNIIPEKKIFMLNRIDVSETGKILVEDPETGKYIVLSSQGKITGYEELACESVFVKKERVLKFVTEKGSKRGYGVKVYFSNKGKMNKKSGLKFYMRKNVQNIQFLGLNREFIVYAVLGTCEDNPEYAEVVKVNLKGKITGRVRIPELPDMAVVRYLRIDNNDNIYFAQSSESGYRIFKYSFKK